MSTGAHIGAGTVTITFTVGATNTTPAGGASTLVTLQTTLTG